ncbi:sigma-70 family RNA polymerase sigma factor [Sediminibacterium sp.]|uniref:sigma-70 family RNA polymerase sigma factor n=1 Tax=Sediminibacterium sp. TaxID=1917865 RepID=UPI0027370711|nr:sigma-70 family RNA polymerase sigma factor [Sediminibacterium sp.]MDP3394154.1 sigma-70 family RNA polymerase sigma factor [Sediminibacterium sp.]MDP3566257.1 sigma-70 family RNA polymerase sigma factor [Sediminibacterium sp.]
MHSSNSVGGNEEIRDLLVAIAYNNDQSAYRALFFQLHGKLKQFSFSIVRSEEEAEDIVSELFVLIIQRKEQLCQLDSPLYYFYATVRNMSLNLLKKQKRRAGLSMDEWQVQLNSIYFRPDLLMITEEMVLKIKMAINSLPNRCRLIFKLIKEDGLKYKEVAELLNISIKTVEAQMAIAMRRMAQSMQVDLQAKTVLEKKVKK